MQPPAAQPSSAGGKTCDPGCAVPALPKGEPRGGRCPPSVGGKLAGIRRRSHPYELKNFEPSANYAPGTMRYVCVGADSIRPVVSPPGKQRRRKAPTMHHRTFYDEIRRYHESNMVYWQHCCIGWCVTVLLKNLQRWRADDPPLHGLCHRITERKFRCVRRGGTYNIGGRVPPNHRGKNFGIRAKPPALLRRGF